MAGYQGWFFAPGDGSERGWIHWGAGKFSPGNCTVDLWPDMSEATDDEKYATEFRKADGTVASVFSSYNPLTVERHFSWMREYGIDGVFLQRFAGYAKQARKFDAANGVMENVNAAAVKHGRTWALMYDLSGCAAGDIEKFVIPDWRRLVDGYGLTQSPAYQHHNGMPVVAVWGVGFKDGREYTLEECARLVDFLKNDPKYGGAVVMLGTPYYWREQKADATRAPELHGLLKKADIISPWSVGRYRTAEEFAADKLPRTAAPDMAWCGGQKVGYMPVVFPGFRWKNLMKTRGKPEGGVIERAGGRFFREQGESLIKAGARMLYIAMFDEVDEGTAIFKIDNNPPVGASGFGTGEGEADLYLKLAGRLGRLLKASTDFAD
jgi:hypothetical protein